jgi:hydroxymethylpyrimidine pyrophosphatase-like HAD family hydrolase
MGNAAPEVIAAADRVAPSVFDDGLAAVIEEFVLRNGRG